MYVGLLLKYLKTLVPFTINDDLQLFSVEFMATPRVWFVDVENSVNSETWELRPTVRG